MSGVISAVPSLPLAGGTLTGNLVINPGNLTLSFGNEFLSAGSLDIQSAGQGLKVAEGSNAKQGTATLTAGTVTVANTSVTATSRIFPAGQSAGGTPGGCNISARTAGTSFTITSTSATDTSVVAFEMYEVG